MRSLRIVGPCSEKWAGMRGTGSVRRCDACATDVHDLSRMTQSEAFAYVLERGGRVCGRAPARADGEIVLPAEHARPAGRGTAWLAATLGAAVTACSSAPGASVPTEATSHVPVAAAGANVSLPASSGAGADADNDGIPDATDKCPYEPETVNGYEDEDGCPDKGFIVIETCGMTVLEMVHFTRGSSTVLPDSDPIVKLTADALAQNPSITKVEVQGHASADERDPQKTSEARANAVIAKLVAAGVDKSRLVAKGFGATAPLESNATAEGREKNRRVEFRVVDPSSPSLPPSP